MPWDGTVLGDATLAPYDAPIEFAQLIRAITETAGVPNLGGIYRRVANELAPTIAGAVSPVNIDTGEAIVNGTFYSNTASVAIAIPNSVASRYDRIVLRKDYAAQTVRITRIAGVEGGGVPALVQVLNTTWDIPICSVRIQVAALTLFTDDRELIPGWIDIPYRQGGNIADWGIPGNTNFSTALSTWRTYVGYKTIAAAGTTITYPATFLQEPFVHVTYVGVGARFANISGFTPATCIVHVYDDTGADVGGAVYWTATGVI